MLFTAVSRPSSQWFCLVQPPKHSCLKSVPKHEWKRSSHTQSVSVFRRGVTALSSQILFLCFLGFCFPSGHDTFSVPIGHLFPIFGAELNGTFLVTPVYLHRGAPFLSLGRSLNGTFLVTPVYLHRGAPSFAPFWLLRKTAKKPLDHNYNERTISLKNYVSDTMDCILLYTGYVVSLPSSVNWYWFCLFYLQWHCEPSSFNWYWLCFWYSPRHYQILVLSGSHAYILCACLVIVLLPSCIIVAYR